MYKTKLTKLELQVDKPVSKRSLFSVAGEIEDSSPFTGGEEGERASSKAKLEFYLSS